MKQTLPHADDESVRFACIALLLTVFIAGAASAAPGAVSAPANPSHTRYILPAPEPFSLSAYDAIEAIAMLRRAKLLEYWDGRDRPSIVPVRTLWAVFLGVDTGAFPGHRRRYDLVLNGNRLDWNHIYIEFAGRMTNLRLLFTYRNQYPPAHLVYRIPETF